MWIAIGIAIVVLFVFLFYKRFNNYVFIARNLTYIHEILNNEYKERFPDEDTLLMTCGIIDTLSYKFSLEDVKGAIHRAKTGECFKFNYGNDSINRHDIRFILKYSGDLFLNFIIQLETMMFIKDSSFHPSETLNIVASQAENIERAIDGAKCSYANGKRPIFWLRAVTNFMSSYTFEGLRNELGIIPISKGGIYDEESCDDKKRSDSADRNTFAQTVE